MRESTSGDVFGGKYRLVGRIGQGGMGAVWTAEHLTLAAPVAIKLMDPSFLDSPAHRARFEREAKAAAQLRSPHVVVVHDYGVEGDVPYIVMELLEGEDLAVRLRRRKRLSLAETVALAVPIGKALARAHAAGIVHRDLKPSNVFVARVDGDEIVKVLDFGIAKATGFGHSGDDSTSTDALLGSPNYMSPEQVRGWRSLDHRTDLWSFGVILFRALTGVLPFRGDTSGDLLVRICTDPLPSARALAPDLPATIDDFFERAFARDPAERFSNVGELLRALASLLPASELARLGDAVVVSDRASLPSIDAGTRVVSAEVSSSAPRLEAREPGTLTEAGSQITPPRPARRSRVLALSAVAAFAVVLTAGVWTIWSRTAPDGAAAAGEAVPATTDRDTVPTSRPTSGIPPAALDPPPEPLPGDSSAPAVTPSDSAAAASAEAPSASALPSPPPPPARRPGGRGGRLPLGL